MRTYGTFVAIVVCGLGGLASAQPGGSDLPVNTLPAAVNEPAPDMGPMQPVQPAQEAPPQGPQLPDPATAPTRATFVSSTDQPWDVFVDREPICATPCTLGLAGVNFVALKTQENQPIRLDVGYLPQGDVMVTGRPMRSGMYAGGIVMTTFAGMSLATGITLTAVGYGKDSSGLKTAGLITGVAGGVGLYAGIYLMRKALPKVTIGPAQPYATGNQVGFAGSF